MFYKFGLIILIVCNFSCNNNEQIVLKQNKEIDTALIIKYLAEDNYSKALSIVDKQLEILKITEPISDYIYFNQWFINKIKSKKNLERKILTYYKNIFDTDNRIINDSILKNIICNSYYLWGEYFFQTENRIDDSITICIEKALSINKERKYLAGKEERYAYQILGILSNQQGDLKKTLNYYSLQKKLIDTSNHKAVAANAINMAIVMNEIGLWDSAIIQIQPSLLFKDIPATKVADLYTTISEIQSKKKLFSEAKISVITAINILDTFTSIGKDIEEKKAEALKQKGILERLNNEYPKSIQTQLQAILHYKATGNLNGRSIAKIYIELGKSYQANIQYDSALKYYHIALQKVVKVDNNNIFSLPEKNQLYAENTIMESLDAKANVLQLLYAQKKNIKYLQTAVQCSDLIVEVEKSLLQNFSYDESKLLMLKESRTRSEKAINSCYQLFTLTNDNSWAQKAFEFAEKNKAFVLLESIKRNIASNSTLQNDSLYQNVQSLQTRLAYINRQLIETNNTKKDSLLVLLKSEKNNVETKLLFANNELKLSSTGYNALLQNKDTTSILNQANSLIDGNTGLIEFFVGDSSNYTFLYTKKDGLTLIKNDSTFLQSMHNYIAFFTDKNKINNEPLAYQNAAYTFYTKINISKLSNPLITKLLFITDGSLNFVPFEALVTSIGKEQSIKSLTYLINSKQVSYGNSVASLLQQSNTTSTQHIVAFAPAFINSENGKVPLLYSIDELAAIKKENSTGKYFIKNAATISAFKTNSSTNGILHIATHADADTSANMQSSIAFYDSSIYLNELYSMHFNANLVVLSACETNIGLLDKSEGSMSLARGFYYAGAKNIITSLWNVNDKSTATLFANFYSNVKQNNYTEALQKAKFLYLQNSASTNASPYYWASFIHIGYSKKQQNNHFVYWVVLAIVSLLSIFLLRKYKK